MRKIKLTLIAFSLIGLAAIAAPRINSSLTGTATAPVTMPDQPGTLSVWGRLVAWGDNSMGQLNVPPGKFDTVSAVAFHAEAIAH